MSQVFKKRIMRRVYAIWLLRRLFSPFSMKLLILLGALKQSANMIFVRSVIHNYPDTIDPVASYHFISSAFFHTETTVKILLITILAFSFWLLRDIIFRHKMEFPYILGKAL